MAEAPAADPGNKKRKEAPATTPQDAEMRRLMEEPLKLNVGGRLFETTRSTLCKFPNTMLARRFAPDAFFASRIVSPSYSPSGHVAPTSGGAHFLDADPDCFEVVLRGLRHGSVPELVPEHLHMDQHEWENVLNFYGFITEGRIMETLGKRMANERQANYEAFMSDFVAWLEGTPVMQSAKLTVTKVVRVCFSTSITYPPHSDGSPVSSINSAEWLHRNASKWDQCRSWCKDLADRLDAKEVTLSVKYEHYTRNKGAIMREVLQGDGSTFGVVHTKNFPVIDLKITYE